MNTKDLTKLDKAVIRQLGGKDSAAESMPDIARHGISGGFHGFIYYSDTIAFFKRNRAKIVALVREMAQEFGQDPIEFVAGFNCLKQTNPQYKFETREEIARALYGRIASDDTQVPNALSWFAAEETARKLTDN